MAELKMTAPGRKSIRPLVASALANELRLLESGIEHTRERPRLSKRLREKADLRKGIELVQCPLS